MTTACATELSKRTGRKSSDNRYSEVPLSDELDVAAYFYAKDVIERVVATGLLCVLLPFIGLLVFLVTLSSRGPGIFRQIRVGKNGKLFVLYKLRSMRLDA